MCNLQKRIFAQYCIFESVSLWWIVLFILLFTDTFWHLSFYKILFNILTDNNTQKGAIFFEQGINVLIEVKRKKNCKLTISTVLEIIVSGAEETATAAAVADTVVVVVKKGVKVVVVVVVMEEEKMKSAGDYKQRW